MAELPAIYRLGYAIDVTRITPMDISVVDQHVLTSRRLISYDIDDTRDVNIDGKLYKVPRAISIRDDNPVQQGEYITFQDGKEAADAFRADISYAIRYFAVSGTTAATFSLEKSFLRDKQYAFFSYTAGKYSALLGDYVNFLNETALESGVADLPKPFDSSNQDAVSKYKRFFEMYGSHIIINASYGARYPLSVWSSNERQGVVDKFTSYVNATFSGIPTGGNFDPNLTKEPDYDNFFKYMGYLVTVSGGNSLLAGRLTGLSGDWSTYNDWKTSIPGSNAQLLSFQLVEMWTLMKLAYSETLRNYADPLYAAFMYIAGNPLVYQTHVSLDIQSDWADFNLLTPSAVIIPDPANPYPPTNTIVNNTRIQWGKEYSHDYQRQVIRFYVINDGSPIDFSISHGSGPNAQGKAIATIENISYPNTVITDNVWNTLRFYNAPVNPNPSTRQSRDDNGRPYASWDDILHDYLSKIGASA